jgi:hypothetical protein
VNWRRPLELVWAADEWVIDHVFQPVANRLADYGISTFRAARISFVICIVIAISSAAYTIKAEQAALGAAITFLIVGGWMGALMLVTVIQERRPSNIWLRPEAYLMFWGARLYLTFMLAFDTFRVFVGTRNGFDLAFDVLYLVGMCFWACRNRPPARKHAKAPADAAQARQQG